MFAPGLVATWARSLKLIVLSAVVLTSLCVAADNAGELPDTRARQVPRPLSPAGTSTVLPALQPSSEKGGYSDERIRLLNLLLAVPMKFDELTAEVATLQVLEGRFNRRYGPNSVASRSVRDRLELLWSAWRSGRGVIDR